jgi:hypothetical protein
MLREVKGADLRRDACDTSRNLRRHTFGYMGEVLKLVERVGGRLVGRIWIKGIGIPMDGMAVYTYSTQSIYSDFQDYLSRYNDFGVVIFDSRLKHMNTPVAHSIFTQKFKTGGDAYHRVIELPGFSHSDNHAGLQAADTICSAILTPIAVHTYCIGHVESLHVRPEYSRIKTKFKDTIKLLQHRYTDETHRSRGGLIVSDAIRHRPGGLLFR